MLNQATHIFLDAARMGDQVNEALRLNKEHDSLYRGGPEQKLTSVAPYIFRFQPGSPFAHWYLEHGWGNSWGILFSSTYGLPDLYKHFRKFLKVTAENGQEMYFRFYDPRVLRTFLPTCDAAQLREFFGPVTSFLPEGENPANMLRYEQHNGVLKTQQLVLADMYQPPAKPSITEEVPVPALQADAPEPLPARPSNETAQEMPARPQEKKPPSGICLTEDCLSQPES